MRFVQIKEIKEGMKIAKPIYNQKGVLLYGRGTEIKTSVLKNIENLNLFGLYILEPTEPLPPMTDEELEFERFQIVAGYILAEELQNIINGNITSDFDELVDDICLRYGNGDHRINFIQSIRSPFDHVYKHSVNVAILTALMTHQLNTNRNEQHYLVAAALLHDIGKLLAPQDLLNKAASLTQEELRTIRSSELKGYELIRDNYYIPAGIRRYFSQMAKELSQKISSISYEQKMLLGTKVLKMADLYDILTAMRIYKDPMSEFSAISFMLERSNEFDENLVNTIIKSINILPVGACVELTNGQKGLVLSENEYYPLRPRVLSFKDNVVYDLGQRKTYDKIHIKDIMKTMDNRFVFSNN